MTDHARLEITISKGPDGCFVGYFAYEMPQSNAEISNLPSGPFEVKLDLNELRENQHNSQLYGQLLTEALFIGKAGRIFTQAREAARYHRLPLKVRLTIEDSAAELNPLHWETLLSPNSNTPISIDEKILFSRFRSSNNLIPFNPIHKESLNTLAVISNPTDLEQRYPGLNQLDMTAEIERARNGLAETDLVLLGAEKKNPATLEDLLSGVRNRDILYLVCHGAFNRNNQPCLWLQKKDGSADIVDVQTVITQLDRLSSLPMLAILVSCGSAGPGNHNSDALQALGPQLIELGVPAVLAMNSQISFPTVSIFLPILFRELWHDGQIDRAITAARGVIHRTQLDWWSPVLFSRLTDNQLFLLPEEALPLSLQENEPETIYIPGGKFWMGRDPDPGIPEWEGPRHQIDQPAYRIGKYPVTNREFREFVQQSTPEEKKEMRWQGRNSFAGDDLPVTGVTWRQAMAFCKWLSRKTNRTYTLPTEAQWEKAARGPRGWLYPWGNEWQSNRCNDDIEKITPVNCYSAQNPYGCWDMVGNAREWTLSLWGEQGNQPDFCYPLNLDSAKSNANAMVRRVVRGGAARKTEAMTCTARSGFDLDDPGPAAGRQFGFRVVMNV